MIIQKVLYFSLFFITMIQAACNVAAKEFPNEEKCLSPLLMANSYAEAYQLCDSRGAEVVKIENIYDNAFIISNLVQYNASAQMPYIGVERSSNGNWVYANGGPLTYANWAPGQPDLSNPQKQCAVLNGIDGKWSIDDCTATRPYFCSYHEAINGSFCPPGWIYSNITQLCYYVKSFNSENSQDWELYNRSEAEAACHLMNGHLASIHSEEENNFVYDLLKSNVQEGDCNLQWAWIGLNGTGIVGNGQWIDGSPVDYTGGRAVCTTPAVWMMSNDEGCMGKFWRVASDDTRVARFVCRKA